MSDIKKIFTNFKYLLTLILFSFCNVMGYTDSSKIVIFVIVIMLFFMELPEMIASKIKWHFSFNIFLLFSVFCLLSSIWSYEPDLAIKRFIALIILDLFYITMWNITYKKREAIDILVNIVILSGIFLAFYVILYYGPIKYYQLLSSGWRVGTEITNVNYIGLNLGFTVICCFYKFFCEKKISYIFLSFFPFVVALGTGSRKVLILLVISFLFFFLSYNSNSLKDKIVIILKFLLIIFASLTLIKMPIFSTINDRFVTFTNLFSENGGVVDDSTITRKKLIENGYDIWQEHLLIGVGANNSAASELGVGVYFHNNYIELLSTVGLVGFVLYYLLYFIPVVKLIFSKKKNKYYSLILNLIVINMVLDFACVSYYSFQNYMYFLIMYLSLYVFDSNNKIKSGGIYED